MAFFFFKQKTAYEFVDCDWSSDVCSSDLFSDFGGDGNDGAEGWPTRNQAVAQDEFGYFEWAEIGRASCRERV